MARRPRSFLWWWTVLALASAIVWTVFNVLAWLVPALRASR